ncbi:WD40 repeat-like protein [Sistotremastrum niveocremeum HHB9708]|uniref:WD40 repeat-like protein n=1 Tax=Sistotremastrum niveocremeum HHB9708 TaxID=1314777 RepID=A0A164SF37_9AGAM|nr:WD40 repeat-like protein [Sistotremastrum niveocremeum HHB9708]
MDIEIFVNEARGTPQTIDNELPQLYVTISTCDERPEVHRTDVWDPKHSDWYTPLDISVDSRESELDIALVQERTRKRDKSLGVVTYAVGELMDAQEGHEEVTILFDLADLNACIHLTLSLRSKPNSQRTTERLLSKAQMDVDHLAPPSFLKHDLPDPSSLEDSVWVDFLNVFEKFSAVASLIDGLASICPLANLAWKLMSVAYKAIRSQSKRDQRVISLVKTMTNLYGFVESVDARSSLSRLSDVVSNIVEETVRCATFIGEYTRRGFPKRVLFGIFSSAEDAIQNFEKTFRDLQSQFNEGLILDSMRLLEGTRNDSARLTHVLPYVRLAETHVSEHCYPGTRQEVFDDVMSWIARSREGDEKRVLYWLSGLSGSGKTAFAASLTSECCRAGVLGASFHFDEQSMERSDATNFFATLAINLATLHPAFGEQILVKSVNMAVGSIDDQFEKLVLKPLLSVDVLTPIVIIIDAVDECAESRRNELLSVLIHRSSELPSHVRLFISSREEDDICTAFKSLSPEKFIHRTLDIQSMENKRDVETYVRGRFKDLAIQKMREGKPNIDESWPGEHRIKALVDRSCGLFIWPSTAFTVLEKALNPNTELNAILDETCGAVTTYGSLDKLYLSCLRRIGHWHEKGYNQLYQQIIGTLVVAGDSMSTLALGRLLNISAGDIGLILESLKSFLAGGETPASHIRFLHPSYSAFVTDSERCTDTRGFIDHAAHHRALALQCLRVMDQLRRNTCDLPVATFGLDQVHEIPDIVEKNVAEELRYAIVHWINHILQSEPDDDGYLAGQIQKFLSRHAIHWLEAVCLVHRGFDIISFLSEVRVQMSSTTCASKALYHLLGGMEMLCRQFPMISHAGWRIYDSVWPLIPDESPLAYFRSRYAGIPRVIKRAPRVWSSSVHLRSSHNASPAEVISIVFSGDGGRFASLSSTGIVDVWETTSYSASLSLPSVASEFLITAIAISKDGRLLLVGQDNGEVSLWDVETGIEVLHAECLSGSEINCCSFSFDGSYIAAGSNQDLTIWHAQTASLIVNDAIGEVVSVCFSRDSQFLFATFRHMNTSAGQISFGVTSRAISSRTTAFTLAIRQEVHDMVQGGSPDTLLLMVGRIVYTLDRHTGFRIATTTLSESVQGWRFTWDGLSAMGQCIHCHAVEFLLIPDYRAHKAEHVRPVSSWLNAGFRYNEISESSLASHFCPNCVQIVAADGAGNITHFPKPVLMRGSDHCQISGKSKLGVPSFSPSGSFVMVPRSKEILVSETKSGRQVAIISVGAVITGPSAMDNRELYIACRLKDDGSVVVANFRTRELVFNSSGDGGAILGTAWHPSKPLLALCSSSEVQLWNIDERRQVQTYSFGDNVTPESSISHFAHIALSPSGSLLAAQLSSNSVPSIFVWNVSAPEPPRIVHVETNNGFSFSGDETRLLIPAFFDVQWDFHSLPMVQNGISGGDLRLHRVVNLIRNQKCETIFMLDGNDPHNIAISNSGRVAYVKHGSLEIIDLTDSDLPTAETGPQSDIAMDDVFPKDEPDPVYQDASVVASILIAEFRA